MRLLLFDIDGTLIRSHGAGRAVLSAAMKEVYGTAGPIDTYRFGGKTDRRIISDLLTAAGLKKQEIDGKLTAVFETMTHMGREHFPTSGMTLCPGIERLLSAVLARPDAVVGLLTGNIEGTAPLKLAAAGIDPAQFRLGAYGSDAADRNKLPALAMQRAAEITNCTFIGANTSIIGDTPADILCARAGQATAVAVASGWHARETLSKHHPDFLFDNLLDTNAVVEALFS